MYIKGLNQNFTTSRSKESNHTFLKSLKFQNDIPNKEKQLIIISDKMKVLINNFMIKLFFITFTK